MGAGHGGRAGPTDKVLYASFFLLGMGLMAPWSGILQTMDYMGAVFEKFNPSRILTVCYVTVDLISLFVLFFFPHLWPNKKSRMATGYILFTAVLVILPIVDYVMLHYAATSMGPDKAKTVAYVLWALASGTVGGSDALISTVAYGESAAIGPTYTHAFIGGKALSGVILSVLRCISKGAMPQDLEGLKRSTSIYLSFAAAIVFCCVIIVIVILPKKQQQIDALKKRPTLKVMQSIKHEQYVIRQATLRSRHSSSGSGRLPAAATSPSLVRSLSMAAQPQLERVKTMYRAGADHFNHLAHPKFGLFDVIDSVLEAQSQGLPDVEAGSLPQVAEGAEEVSSSSSSSDSDSEDAVCRTTAAGITDKDADKELQRSHKPKKTAHAWRQTAGKALHQHRHHHHHHHHHHQDHAVAAADTGSTGGTGEAAAPSKNPPGMLDAAANLSSCAAPADIAGVMPPEPATCKDSKRVVLLSPFAAAADAAPESPRKHLQGMDNTAIPITARSARQLPRSQVSLKRFAAGGLVREGVSVAVSSWLAMRLIYPYMIAVCLVFFIANTIFPMCLSPERGVWPAAGTWYTLILVLAYECGTLLGSTLPIWKPKYPRTTVLCAALGMFVFVPAYLLALLLKGGPGAFISLTFVMMTYGSYIAAMVFVLGPHGLLPADAELVEVLLVLVLTVGYILGLFLSWIWKIPGLAPHT